MFNTLQDQIEPSLLLEEQVKVSLSNYLFNGISLFLGSTLLFYILFQHADVDHFLLISWMIFQSFFSLLMILLYFHYHQQYEAVKQIWRYWVDIPLAVITALSWGMSWVLFIDPSNLVSAFLLNAIICGVLAAYSIIGPLDQLRTTLSQLACMLPVIIKSFWMAEIVFTMVGLGACILLLACFIYSQIINKLYTQTIIQREENAKLALSLQQEKQRVEQVSQNKTRFLAAASHDLRQPIQAMHFFESALSATLTEAKQHKLLSKITESNNNLANLLEALLEISTLDSGSVTTRPQAIYVDDILYSLHRQYRDLAFQNQIDLRCVSTTLQAFVDPQHLTRILSNLIVNAIQHMGKPGKILVGVRRQSDGFMIGVWDNGEGISKENQHKIFNEFYQVNNREYNHSKGQGLGLSSVKRLVKLINGRLMFCSTFGKGCYFGLNFPSTTLLVQHKRSNLIHLKTREKELDSDPLIFSGVHPLLVEDDADVLDALTYLLKSWGLNPYTASSMEEAIDSAKKNLPNVIITDYHLPNEKTGSHLIATLEQQNNLTIPAIILTGTADKNILKQLSQQPQPILYKPIQANLLKATLLSLITDTTLR